MACISTWKKNIENVSVVFHAKFLFNVMQLHKYKYLFNIQQWWHSWGGDVLEKMRLQTHYCTDPNKSKLANLQLGVLPRGTFYNHTETDRVEHRRKSTSWVGRFTTADWCHMWATLHPPYSSKMQKHIWRNDNTLYKIYIKNILCKQSIWLCFKENRTVKKQRL